MQIVPLSINQHFSAPGELFTLNYIILALQLWPGTPGDILLHKFKSATIIEGTGQDPGMNLPQLLKIIQCSIQVPVFP